MLCKKKKNWLYCRFSLSSSGGFDLCTEYATTSKLFTKNSHDLLTETIRKEEQVCS